MRDFARTFIIGFEVVVLAYYLYVNIFYLIQLGLAALEIREHQRRIRLDPMWRVLDSPVTPKVTVIAPAYNEELSIGESVRALIGLDYPNLQVVIVNDGSTDRTLSSLLDEFDMSATPAAIGALKHEPVRGVYRSVLQPHLTVVDKENGGKADALNAGLNQVRTELVCAIDADTIIEPDALQRMVRPFLMEEESVIAAGGTVRVANGSRITAGRVTDIRLPRRFLARVQVIEYLRAFLFGRTGWNRMGGNTIISGAFGLFRTRDVIEVGGYRNDTVGEDAELVVRLRRHAKEQDRSDKVVFVPDPVAWTEVPSGVRSLGRQRARWHRGLAETLWTHKGAFLRPRYGPMGMVALPYHATIELLAPIVEFLGLVALIVGLSFGFVNIPFAIAFILVAYGLGVIVSLSALLLEELTYRRYRTLGNQGLLVFAAFAEHFGYRQLTVVWRIMGLGQFFRRENHWGNIERDGFDESRMTDTVPAGTL